SSFAISVTFCQSFVTLPKFSERNFCNADSITSCNRLFGIHWSISEVAGTVDVATVTGLVTSFLTRATAGTACLASMVVYSLQCHCRIGCLATLPAVIVDSECRGGRSDEVGNDFE